MAGRLVAGRYRLFFQPKVAVCAFIVHSYPCSRSFAPVVRGEALVKRMMIGAVVALVAFSFTAGYLDTVSARTPQVRCVRAPGDRICRISAMSVEQVLCGDCAEGMDLTAEGGHQQVDFFRQRGGGLRRFAPNPT